MNFCTQTRRRMHENETLFCNTVQITGVVMGTPDLCSNREEGFPHLQCSPFLYSMTQLSVWTLWYVFVYVTVYPMRLRLRFLPPFEESLRNVSPTFGNTEQETDLWLCGEMNTAFFIFPLPGCCFSLKVSTSCNPPPWHFSTIFIIQFLFVDAIIIRKRPLCPLSYLLL